jgi:Transglutaminase-like superfamily
VPNVGQKLFGILWRSTNVALLLSTLLFLYSAGWEYSVRRYLTGFSDAIVPTGATPEKRVQAILDWIRAGPPRSEELNPGGLAMRDPETTLNYERLLSVCGTATNAFLNLARSSHLQARRLLLLTADRTAKHVVAEVFLDGRWVVVDPTYRIILRDASGQMLTRSELKNPQAFAAAIASVPGYPSEYTYEKVAHVRIARLPMEGLHLRGLLDLVFPGWDEKLDWSLLLERESFFTLTLAAFAVLFLLLLRQLLAWYADRRLVVSRYRLRAHLARAGSAFFSPPEIK